MSLVQKYSPQIQTLSYSQAVIPLAAPQAAPEGCAVAIASDRCTVNLMLRVRRALMSVLRQRGPVRANPPLVAAGADRRGERGG